MLDSVAGWFCFDPFLTNSIARKQNANSRLASGEPAAKVIMILAVVQNLVYASVARYNKGVGVHLTGYLT